MSVKYIYQYINYVCIKFNSWLFSNNNFCFDLIKKKKFKTWLKCSSVK